jgi:hypothetical protein
MRNVAVWIIFALVSDAADLTSSLAAGAHSATK